MLGAAHLCARAAQRAGAGYVRLSSPGVEHDPLAPTEAVLVAVEPAGWDADVVSGCERFGALAVGPGLGTGDATAAAVRATVAGAPVPMVVDGDGLNALATAPGGATAALARRSAPTVLTPHDGEFARLAGGPPGDDRLGAVRALAAETGTVVVSKGSTTVVADPVGTVLVSTTGDTRLATAGTGDVLTGVICALLAQQVPALRAAAAGAFLHGRAGAIAWPRGMVAGDLTDLLPLALAELPEAGCSAPPPSTRS
jgi:NAD(P)H-hydrate epimerase